MDGDNVSDYQNFAYDAFGRVTSETGNGYQNIYTYDLNSNVASYTLKEGSTTKSSETYGYDSVNHLTSQNVNGKSITYTYSHGLMMQRTGEL